ncbi:hypothetical protein FFLO_04497 [Filobasidium floriforme]|uniref:Uncharacterized protein n=1 Tax=Filobasidium floriforme TaxID=5210 RepID=A0A8K0JJ58_9TREE|nr:uncharacterized protein HD553DRAFT_304533 [Filobasidium floriforme]KAG7531255.1 hypothetical protein FFLO_04497 [Filobasidium floriforme]KAH8089671.1 hypothetical protein HD553DRAFT_304533 [Filobasidium floriforme]
MAAACFFAVALTGIAHYVPSEFIIISHRAIRVSTICGIRLLASNCSPRVHDWSFRQINASTRLATACVQMAFDTHTDKAGLAMGSSIAITTGT